jgi:hypothetical protein
LEYRVLFLRRKGEDKVRIYIYVTSGGAYMNDPAIEGNLTSKAEIEKVLQENEFYEFTSHFLEEPKIIKIRDENVVEVIELV